MRSHRIFAILLRFLYAFWHNLDQMLDAFYWPTIDLLLMGLTTRFFATQTPNASIIVLTVLSGIVFWLLVWRAQHELTIGLLEELWSRNLLNIFGSPLTFSEWLVALLFLGIIKSIVSFSFALTVAFILYKAKLFFYGFYFLPLGILLLMFGWAVGMFITSLIYRYGTNIQTFAWAGVMILSPFSAAYYPVSSLPIWAQKISNLLPTSYIFENIRMIINHQTVDWSKLEIALGLNLIYLALGLFSLHRSFKKVLQNGVLSVY